MNKSVLIAISIFLMTNCGLMYYIKHLRHQNQELTNEIQDINNARKIEQDIIYVNKQHNQDNDANAIKARETEKEIKNC